MIEPKVNATRLRRARGTLFRKYALYCAGLVSIALLASGLIGLYFSYQEQRSLLDEAQREKVRTAAVRIEHFARVIEGQLRAALLVEQAGIEQNADERHLELIRLLRQAPAVSDVIWVDAQGIQQIKVSRTVRDRIGPAEDHSDHPAVVGARSGNLYAGPVYFRSGSEPYATLAVNGQGSAERRGSGPGSVLIAEVNLKLVWEIVSTIRVGVSGNVHVVDGQGRLISHPDISLVLRMTDLSAHPQVQAALVPPGAPAPDVMIARTAADGKVRSVLTASAPIPALGWHAFVELPVTEAFRPIYDAALRLGLVIALGVGLAILAALVLARRMTAPILALEQGAARLGAGHLDERVRVDTGDELQALGDQFNRMAARLNESYESLEAKIAERTRQLAAANEAKSRFLAVASHDLRQPVHALGLFLAQVRDARSTDERERLLGRIEASSRSVTELLEALFDISKLDAGKIVPQPIELPVQTLFNRLEQTFALAAQDKGLRLRIRPSGLHIVSDPLLLERVLLNLAANAVRYTKEGGVMIACRRRGSVARIEIRDTGIGIPEDAVPHIFEEFYQAHGAVDEQARGLGLGLAIVKRLVDLLEARIEVRSIEGRGSIFSIEVPLATVVSHAVIEPSGQPVISAPFAAGTALVIDDDRDAREALAGLLGQWGWHVIIAPRGADALDALRNGAASVDVIVCDYGLADGERGDEVIGRVRAACGSDIPAIIVSGDAQDLLREVARNAGLHGLAKPVEPAKLRALLQHLMAERAVANSAAE
ncbi:MAG: ATP-binding protein [Burkholderiales bacterium]